MVFEERRGQCRTFSEHPDSRFVPEKMKNMRPRRVRARAQAFRS
jgi:hypothetical protein